MAEERVQRRLAAILAADMVGYSRLMRDDETGTLTQLKNVRTEIFDPKAESYGGRIFKTTGDGFLIEFPSAVDALQFAVDVQQAMQGHSHVDSEDRRVALRIGLNVGDVIVEGEDLYGDGVNVASRIEGLADAGGICISGSVYEQVQHKLDLAYEDMGAQSLKNIADPVRVFRVMSASAKLDKSSSSDTDALFRKPAVAVLPFENLSDDPSQEYFADGLTEDIITALSLWRLFPVIARNSTFSYKGQSPDVRKVGEELAARYVIEGSVRKSGDRIRVTAQLINAETGHHVWAERFDRDLEEIFELQDELTQRIAATVVPELERTEHKRAVTNKPVSLDAWDHVQRGFADLYEFNSSGNLRAREEFTHALKLDPSYSTAYIGVAWSHIRDLDLGSGENRITTTENLLDAALEAVKLDPSDSFAHLVLGIAYHWSGQYDLMEPECERALELNPNNANALQSKGHALSLTGRPNEGIPFIEKAISLNPQDPRNYLYYSFLAQAHLLAKRFDQAMEWAGKAIQWRPDHPLPHLVMAASLGHFGRIDEARAELKACERVRPGYTADTKNWISYKNPADNEHFLDGLRKAGWEG